MIDKLEIDCEIYAKKIDFRTLVLDYFIEEDPITEEQLSDNCDMPIYLLVCLLLMRMQSLENALVINVTGFAKRVLCAQL